MNAFFVPYLFSLTGSAFRRGSSDGLLLRKVSSGADLLTASAFGVSDSLFVTIVLGLRFLFVSVQE